MKDALEILAVQKSVQILSVKPLSGGSINEVFWVETQQEELVIKINNKSRYPLMFEKEKAGLLELSKSNFTVPSVKACFTLEDYQYLLLSHIQSAPKNDDFWYVFAKHLAEMHRLKHEFFGALEDNYMGALPQSNANHTSWTDFYLQERIRPQLELAIRQGYISQEEMSQILLQIGRFLDKEGQKETVPSLVHGDLWNGNFMVDEQGYPALIDPAAHYGHRETDLAMTRLFGGFAPDFYKYYHQFYPLNKGWEKRLEVYQLYPLLIHLNLFGKGYLSAVKQIFRTL